MVLRQAEAKVVVDACAGVVFGDDTQVSELVASKNWGDEGEVCAVFSWAI